MKKLVVFKCTCRLLTKIQTPYNYLALARTSVEEGPGQTGWHTRDTISGYLGLFCIIYSVGNGFVCYDHLIIVILSGDNKTTTLTINFDIEIHPT